MTRLLTTTALLLALIAPATAKAESDAYLDGKMYVLLAVAQARCNFSLTPSGVRALARTGKVVLDGGDGTRGGTETGRQLRAMETGRVCTIMATKLGEYLK